ncbi:MAG: T9SS type A sorting domain-containing protein, partial [Bacteroidota bacterium]
AAPSQIGLYVVAIRIKAYQNGILQSETLQEIPIIVTDCGNQPPNFVQGGGSNQSLAFPGQSISYSMTVEPASQNDSLYVDFQLGDRPTAGWFNSSQSNFSMLVTAQDANQGTFTQTSLPVAVLNSASSPASVQIDISWTPGPEDIGKDYQFDLIAHNNRSYLSQPMQAMLSSYQSLRFKVAPPVPIGVSAAPNNWDGITISWTDLPYDTAALFMIYRVKDTMPELSLPCAVREDTAHFDYLGYTTSWAPYTFGYAPMGIVDETLCYVVTAAKGSIWNITEESCPSEVGCVENFTTSLESSIAAPLWYLEAPEGQDGFILRRSEAQSQTIQLEVFDASGRSVLRSSDHTTETMVPTANLSQGIYWVRIWEKGAQHTLPYWKR